MKREVQLRSISSSQEMAPRGARGSKFLNFPWRKPSFGPWIIVLGMFFRPAAAEHAAWLAAERVFSSHCLPCHGNEKRKGGLDLTSPSGALMGGDSGPAAISGKSDRSLLLRLVRGQDPDRPMPPKGERLTSEEIRTLESWIDAGTPGPAGPDSGKPGRPDLVVRDEDREHWSFASWKQVTIPVNPDVPHPLDRMLLRGIHSRVPLEPEPERGLMLRRLSFTLTGLPPRPGELDSFDGDLGVDAYERLVDRLMARPTFGERWAQGWLDVARFAETAGYERDHPRPHAWPYRDWVIRAANSDMPYDQFVRWQIAGDRLSPEDGDARAATGFLVAGPQLAPISPAQLPEERANQLDDIVSTIGSAFLGLTIGCARCHDHKNEPIPQADYYRLAACLARVEMPSRLNPRGDGVLEVVDESLPWPGAAGSRESGTSSATGRVWAVREGAMRPTYLLDRGDVSRPGREIRPGFLEVLNPANSNTNYSVEGDSRVALASWLTDVERGAGRTLARVIVNRVWQQHFGTGVCATPNDVGVRGAEPADPELVDWLAQRFVAGGWRLKPLHRLIVTSRAWRQRSGREPDAAWRRVALRRLTAEEIRDAMLAISGVLNPQTSGPAIRPWVPAEAISKINANDGWTPDVVDGPATWRRSIYVHRKRVGVFPMFGTFDAAEPTASCARRASTTTPLQALDLLNSRFVREQSASFAARLESEAGADPVRRVELAWRWCAGRAPTPGEAERCRALAVAHGWPAMCQALFLSNAFLYVE